MPAHSTHTIWIGAHTSAAGGVHRALYEGKEIGATTIQLFTSNQRQWHGHRFTKEEVALWEQALDETGIGQVMSHASYLINLGSPVAEILQKSQTALRQEIERCHLLQIPYLNIHPGSATESSEEECLATIVQSLLSAAPLLEQGSTRILLETTAGQGTQVGYRFEQLGWLVEKVHRTIPIGICIDTCHIFAAGYDLRTPKNVEAMFQEFDRTVGLHHLYAFHLNDSQKALGSRVDRHSPLGKGAIGLACFQTLMSSQNSRDLPKYLETPDGPTLWKQEISLLKSFAKGHRKGSHATNED